jgi:hypothetical protein
VFLSNVSGQLYNRLHPLNLSLNIGIKVFVFDLWEAQEMDGSRITGRRIIWNERTERLIDILRQERRVG